MKKSRPFPQPPVLNTSVSNCTFTVHAERPETEVQAIQTIAMALHENARALRTLADVLAQPGVCVGPMVQVGPAHVPEGPYNEDT